MEAYMKKKTSSKKKKSKSFNPNRIFVKGAVDEFIRNGGIITVVDDVIETDVERLLSTF